MTFRTTDKYYKIHDSNKNAVAVSRKITEVMENRQVRKKQESIHWPKPPDGKPTCANAVIKEKECYDSAGLSFPKTPKPQTLALPVPESDSMELSCPKDQIEQILAFPAPENSKTESMEVFRPSPLHD